MHIDGIVLQDSEGRYGKRDPYKSSCSYKSLFEATHELCIIFHYIEIYRHFPSSVSTARLFMREGTELEQFALACQVSGLGTVLCMKLAQDVRNMILHGS